MELSFKFVSESPFNAFGCETSTRNISLWVELGLVRNAYELPRVWSYVGCRFQIIIFPLVFERVALFAVHHILHDNVM